LIFIGSPLGLRTITGVECEEKRENSFLSSIEILIIESCEVYLTQNFKHLVDVMETLNKIPKHKDVSNSLMTIKEYFHKGL